MALKDRRVRAQWLISALWIGASISALCLFANNLDGNEAGKLALARQQVDPAWIPGDWYLGTPQAYQWLFQQFAGWMVRWLEFPIGSLVLRLLGYGFWALALARVTVQLGLTPPRAALAAVLFGLDQSVIAREWMVGTVEPKTFAYAAVLLAYACWRERRWGLSGFWSGLACSFHILVGGYALMALAGLALWPHRQPCNPRGLIRWGVAALLAGLPVLLPLAEQLRGGLPPAVAEAGSLGLPSTAWIYVFLRNPHHLVPATWPPEAWRQALGMVLLFAGGALLCRRAGQRRPSFPVAACMDLILWSLAALFMALVGLLISLVDHEGVILRLYPFRFADTLLVLAAWLLLLRWLPPLRPPQWPLAALVALLLVHGLPNALEARSRLAVNFIDTPQRVGLYGWLERLPDRGAEVLTPPSGFEDLALQTGHPVFGQFKQVPTAPQAIQTWYFRMTALAGGDLQVWQGPGGWPARRRIDRAFEQLDAMALADLVRRYHVGVVVTGAGHPGPQGWHEAYRNAQWSGWLPDAAEAPGHAGSS